MKLIPAIKDTTELIDQWTQLAAAICVPSACGDMPDCSNCMWQIDSNGQYDDVSVVEFQQLINRIHKIQRRSK